VVKQINSRGTVASSPFTIHIGKLNHSAEGWCEVQ